MILKEKPASILVGWGEHDSIERLALGGSELETGELVILLSGSIDLILIP